MDKNLGSVTYTQQLKLGRADTYTIIAHGRAYANNGKVKFDIAKALPPAECTDLPDCEQSDRTFTFDWKPDFGHCNETGAAGLAPPNDEVLQCDIVMSDSPGGLLAFIICMTGVILCMAFYVWIMTNTMHKGVRFLQPTFMKAFIFLCGLLNISPVLMLL